MKQLNFDQALEGQSATIPERDGAVETAEPRPEAEAARAEPSAQKPFRFGPAYEDVYQRQIDRADALAADAVRIGQDGTEKIVKPTQYLRAIQLGHKANLAWSDAQQRFYNVDYLDKFKDIIREEIAKGDPALIADIVERLSATNIAKLTADAAIKRAEQRMR